VASGGGSSPITFSARFVNLWDALKIVTEVASFKYLIRGNVVMLMPQNITVDVMETRSYTVMANVIDRANGVARELNTSRGAGGLGGGPGIGEVLAAEPIGPANDLKKLFGELGVQWPVGSSISYLSIIGKLRVVNTAENLAVFEKVLEEMNVTPRQIEIEARFVEVSQTDLDSLGFQWQQNRALTHNYDPATIAGNHNGGTVVLNPSAGGSTMGLPNNPYDLSQGMRYLNGNALGNQVSAADSVFALQGVFGELDMTTVLHALSQRSNSDLLSAPKVVTKAGQEAVIKVVTEYIYPTTFTVTGLQGSTGGANNNNNTTTTTGAVVEPGGFQTREVGVILQVVPEVSAEGQMINLTMNPQVVSEPSWKNYGSRVPVPNTDPVQYMELPMEQPFFKIRSVSTSVSIYNGATVVMGGMITEVRSSSDDKVPLLGDIPYLGRLFHSKAEHSEKRNLLIFVTARLVDPAGRAVKTNMEPALSGKKAAELVKLATP
jgi:general secretion pathway protein D